MTDTGVCAGGRYICSLSSGKRLEGAATQTMAITMINITVLDLRCIFYSPLLQEILHSFDSSKQYFLYH